MLLLQESILEFRYLTGLLFVLRSGTLDDLLSFQQLSTSFLQLLRSIFALFLATAQGRRTNKFASGIGKCDDLFGGLYLSDDDNDIRVFPLGLEFPFDTLAKLVR